MANPVQHVPSRQNLRNTMGLAREFGFLEFNTIDQVVWDDDFLGDTLDAGYQSVIWDATNDYGKPVSAGIYLYQIRTAEYSSTKKMLLLK